MTARRTTDIGLLGVLIAAVLAATSVGLVTAGGSGAAAAPAASTAAAAASPAPVEQLPRPAGAAVAADPGVVSTTVRVTPASIGSRDSRMEIVVGRKHVHFRNGGRIELAGGLVAELFLDPYPPATRKLWLDVRLTRAPKGTPVANARASMDYDMELMPHGASKATARNVGGGHYLYVLEESMYGAWKHTLRLGVNKRTHEVRLIVVTSPA